MNSFQELNGWGNGNITYNSEADYVIAFSGSGNANITAYEDNDFFASKARSITTLTSPVRDIIVLLDIGNNQAISGIEYVGPYSNIQLVTQVANSSYRINGIRSIDQYNEAFANLLINTALDYYGNWTYDTTVTDQGGNVQSWTTFVTVNADNDYTPSSILSRTQPPVNRLIESNNLIYGNTNVTLNIPTFTNNNVGYFGYHSIPGNLQLARTTLTTTGNLTQSNVTANSHVAWGNGNSLISTLQTTTIYDPAGGSDSQFRITIQRPLTLANVVTVTDAANLNYSSTITVANTSQGQLIHYGNGAFANSFTASGNISTITAALGNVGFVWDDNYELIGNLLYTQIRTTDSQTQASNVSILVYPNSNYDTWNSPTNTYHKQKIYYKRVPAPNTSLFPFRFASITGYTSPFSSLSFDRYAAANSVPSGSGITVPVPFNTSWYYNLPTGATSLGIWLTRELGGQVNFYYRGQLWINRIYLGYGYNFGTGFGPNLGDISPAVVNAALNHLNLSANPGGQTIRLKVIVDGNEAAPAVNTTLVFQL